MEQLSIARRQGTLRRKIFGDLRQKLGLIQRRIAQGEADPRDWDSLILSIIKNPQKLPVKFKLPQLRIILTKFNQLPVNQVNFRYFTLMYDLASRRQHEGRGSLNRFGSERWLMREVYVKLLEIVQVKMNEKLGPEKVNPLPGRAERRLEQLKLPW